MNRDKFSQIDSLVRLLMDWADWQKGEPRRIPHQPAEKDWQKRFGLVRGAART
jgi:hypothetical protein